MNKESLYRSLTIALPVVAVFGATGASGYEWRRMKLLEAETTATQGKLAQIDRELRSYEGQPQTEKFPTVPRTPREQALFLDALRANADRCQVQLIRWSNTTPAPAAPTDKSASALPTGVTPIVSTIEILGRSDSTRQFMYNVLRSRRLLNMSDLKWVRDTWPNTHLTFTLTRYVAPLVALPVSHPHSEPGHSEEAFSPAPGETAAVAPQAQDHSVRPDQAGGLTLPNPMDAPGIAHRTYQSRSETNMSKLSQLDQGQSSDAAHSPAGTDAKH